MSYVDINDNLILETPAEVEVFARETPCILCAEEAVHMLKHIRGKETIKLVFSATCEHRRRS